MISVRVPGQVDGASPAASKKIKVKKKSRDLKNSTDLKQNLDAKTESKSKCVIFWKKCCPCLNTKKKRARQAKRAIAFFCLCVYCFDVGSDLRVGFDLKQRCHHLTGATVLAFVWVPGLFYSLMTFLESDFKGKDGTTDLFSCCQKSIACFFMIFFTWIMTPGFLIAEVFNPDLSKDTKKLKFFEVFFEAYPQLLISLMLMMRLNIYDWLYVGSCAMSFCSLLYGAADAISFKNFDGEGGFWEVFLGIVSLFIDCLFRAVLISFLLASWTFELDAGLQKMWIFFAGLFYIVVVMVYSNYNIAKKTETPMFAVFKGALSSLVASAWLDKDLKYKLRFVSKTVFGFLALIALVKRTVEWSEPAHKRVLNCEKICLNDTLNEQGNKTFTQMDAKNCDSQELSLDKNFQLYILIGLWTLLVLSMLEGLLEKFTNLPMPFTKLQMANEQIEEPIFNTRTTVNRLYEEKKQENDPESKKHELSELPEQKEVNVMAPLDVDQTIVPIAPPSL